MDRPDSDFATENQAVKKMITGYTTGYSFRTIARKQFFFSKLHQNCSTKKLAGYLLSGQPDILLNIIKDIRLDTVYQYRRDVRPIPTKKAKYMSGHLQLMFQINEPTSVVPAVINLPFQDQLMTARAETDFLKSFPGKLKK